MNNLTLKKSGASEKKKMGRLTSQQQGVSQIERLTSQLHGVPQIG